MKKTIVILVAVVVAIGLLAVIIRSRRPHAPAGVGRKSNPPARRGYYLPPKDPGPPMNHEVAARAYSDATLRTTYKNYRTAMATGNTHLQDALKPTLSKERSKVVGWAESDLARATRTRDQEIARKTLDSLRN